MTGPEWAPIRSHEDPALFSEALIYTAAESGFGPRLIERDYFATVLLDYLAATGGPLVFRGGTCLAKVHAGFYRLSEDLDYVIPMPVTAARSKRRSRIEPVRRALSGVEKNVPSLHVIEQLKGANNSTQYRAVIGYTSELDQQTQSIKIEIGLREPLCTRPSTGNARTLLLDPITAQPMVPEVRLPTLSLQETVAEKFRAALSRRVVAIRDFFDIDYAVRRLGIDPHEGDLIDLVARKLTLPGNERIGLTAERTADLERQKETALKPVLREKDYKEFVLGRALEIVARMAEAVA
jgi:predicted nucleotidyltransferase component of viral defense system